VSKVEDSPNLAETRVELREKVRSIAESTVERLGCELVAVHLTSDRTGPVLRLFIDKPGGVDMLVCAGVSRALNPEFDVEDPLPGRYRLEVSSPGFDRPVERRRDFQRFVGFQIKVRMLPGTGRKRYVGELRGLDGEQVLVREHSDRPAHRVPYEHIDRAQLILTTEEYLRFGEEGLPPIEGGPA
jgi:ribosome maturation factor RimP